MVMVMISVIPVLAKCLHLFSPAVTSILIVRSFSTFALPTLNVTNETEVTPSEPKTKVDVVAKQVVSFFNPVTCYLKENQVLEPCLAEENLNDTLCLKYQCCLPSKIRLPYSIQYGCYLPFKDRPQQILRMFGVGLGGVLIVACLPFCCFIVERSPCANPLRRAPKEEDSEDESEESEESEEGEESEESEESESMDLVQKNTGKHKSKKNKKKGRK